MKTVLLTGESASGKSELAKALAFGDRWRVISTSAHLRSLRPAASKDELFQTGEAMDERLALEGNRNWVQNLVRDCPAQFVVVDSIRSMSQVVGIPDTICVNVECHWQELARRHLTRGTQRPEHRVFKFDRPDFVWHSDRTSVAEAVSTINQLAGGGFVDVLIGGQFGSEGKGKLAALIAHQYGWLVRSGGPNAGHWVRDLHYEYCFHHIPSGALVNPEAQVAIAAGATINPDKFLDEVRDTRVKNRLHVDPNTFLVTTADIEEEQRLVGPIGSTAQGVGMATQRRIARDKLRATPAVLDDRFRHWASDHVFKKVGQALHDGERIMLEGTQGSGLSIYHGAHYPYATSRDTNTAGLLSEVGVAPAYLRDVWMVVRTHPIRVGGNSGPMAGETDWDEVAKRAGMEPELLRSRELTSTTLRQRRVGNFDWAQFHSACLLNRPTKLFLSFADYITPAVAGCREWRKLPDEIFELVGKLESAGGVMVAGISTGRKQSDVLWR